MSSHERADDNLSNNVTFQRCQYAYEFAKPFITGKKVLDIGCGLAYGTRYMSEYAAGITGMDYNQETIESNRKRFEDIKNLEFIHGAVPPIAIASESIDVVTAFQFIEHIHPRAEFLKEVSRILKPGGVFLMTTPNAKMSLARNPFHVHEYTFAEMKDEMDNLGFQYELKGLTGSEKVNHYYEANGKWVRSILKWDVLGLHKRIPSSWLTVPYNMITNFMRKDLMEKQDETLQITTSDFGLRGQNLDGCWDIYVIFTKK